LTCDLPNTLFCAKGYTVFRRDRSTPGGGVAIFVKSVIRSAVVDIQVEFNHIEIVCVDLTFACFTCRLICIYRKPGFSELDAEYISDCIRCLKKLCATEKLVIITGDCNLPDIDWSCYHAPNSAIYNMFIDFVNNFGFHQYVNQPTRNENILDIVMATSDTFLEDLSVSVPLGTSDHNTVIFKTNISACSVDQETSVSYYDFAKGDYESVNEYLSAIDWDVVFSANITVQGCWDAFTCIINDVCERFIPVRVSKPVTGRVRKGVHYPHYIKRMLKRKAIVWKCWRLSKSPDDKQAYRTIADDCKRAISKFHAARELALIRKNNLGNFYKFVNSKTQTNITPTALKTSTGAVVTDPDEKAEVFNNFLAVFLQLIMVFAPVLQNRSEVMV